MSFFSNAMTALKNIFKDPPHRWLVRVVVSFVVSRLFYTYFYGLELEDNTLLDCMQYIDPLLLRTDLARSIFYLRDQPPLFNLFLGIVLKTCGTHTNAAFHAVFLASGVALVTSMYLLLVRLVGYNLEVHAMVSSYTVPSGSNCSPDEKKIRALVRAHDPCFSGETKLHHPAEGLIFDFIASLSFALCSPSAGCGAVAPPPTRHGC